MINLPNLYNRQDVLRVIQSRLEQEGVSLEKAISIRNLYFRVSVIASCNLSCRFCHNEGASNIGRVEYAFANQAIRIASEIGFRRVQFTGGEPLLRHDIGDFVKMAKQYVPNVGVTTNGVFLPKRLEGLISNGIDRIHVSLQSETLQDNGRNGEWGLPDWLLPTMDYASSGDFDLRLNLPVSAHDLEKAERLLPELLQKGDVLLFSILPEGKSSAEPFPYLNLEKLVIRLNNLSKKSGWKGMALLRGYKAPNGIRCKTCLDFERCKEQSRSLRLGADHVLRPCLATRAWDVKCDQNNMRDMLVESALLSLDYEW